MSRRFVAQRGPTRVVFATGSLATLADEVDTLGVGRLLVVSSPRGVRDAADGMGRLRDRIAGVLPIAAEHVPAPVVRAAVEEAERSHARGLLSIGGGSSIGLGKAVAVALGLPLAAVPTTYSGSEMTSLYGVTERDEKRTARDPRARPRLVLYDPSLTLGLPPAVTVASLWNAMAHAVEALWYRDAPAEALDDAARALSLITGCLPTLVEHPDDRAARDDALEGAHLAGAALESTGTALHHKLCHVLGGAFGLPHAGTHAVVLPHVVRFHQDAAPEALRRLGEALRGEPVEALFALARRTGAPTSLAALGLPPAALPAVVDRLLAAPFDNPRPLDRESVSALLQAAIGEPG